MKGIASSAGRARLAAARLIASLLALWLLAAASLAQARDIDRTLDLVRDLAIPYYERGRERAKEFPELRTYSDHGIQHAELVLLKSLEAADVIEQAAQGSPGYAPIDRTELSIAAILHDTGMDGGSFRDYADGNALRKDHSLNSAIHVLENREALSQIFPNPDVIALDCMAHSKSCSGLRDLTSEADWTECLRRIDAAVALYNERHPGRPIWFDKSEWTDGTMHDVPVGKKQTAKAYRFHRDSLAKSAATIAALRLGDANREEAKNPVTQAGERIEVDFASDMLTAKTWQDEIRTANITLTDGKGQKTSLRSPGVDSSGYGRMYMAGEQNLAMGCRYNPKTKAVQELFRISRASFPLATQQCIEERLGELDTMRYLPVEAHLQFVGIYSRHERKRIEKSYGRYRKKAEKRHGFPVTMEFAEP